VSHANPIEQRLRRAGTRARLRSTLKALVALTTCVGCVVAPSPICAFDLDLASAGVRWRVGGERVLGQEQPEAFREYDVWVAVGLPWQRYSTSGWGVGTRLLTSVGLLKGAESNALVVSVLPVFAFGSQDGRFNVDLGAGVAVLSQNKFAQQDFGGPLQAALTFGVGIPLYQRLGVGYRFMHYSDTPMPGPTDPTPSAPISTWSN